MSLERFRSTTTNVIHLSWTKLSKVKSIPPPHQPHESHETHEASMWKFTRTHWFMLNNILLIKQHNVRADGRNTIGITNIRTYCRSSNADETGSLDLTNDQIKNVYSLCDHILIITKEDELENTYKPISNNFEDIKFTTENLLNYKLQFLNVLINRTDIGKL